MSAGIVLIIDDEEKLRALLARVIRLEDMWYWSREPERQPAGCFEKGGYRLVLCDVKLPMATGWIVKRISRARHPYVESILLPLYGNIADGVQGYEKTGAFDYITKGR